MALLFTGIWADLLIEMPILIPTAHAAWAVVVVFRMSRVAVYLVSGRASPTTDHGGGLRDQYVSSHMYIVIKKSVSSNCQYKPCCRDEAHKAGQGEHHDYQMIEASVRLCAS